MLVELEGFLELEDLLGLEALLELDRLLGVVPLGDFEMVGLASWLPCCCPFL